MNGHRTADTFRMAGDNPECNTSACPATWRYDERDRLTHHYPGHGEATSTYKLDAVGNVLTSTEGGTTRTFTYTGSQLDTESVGGIHVADYFHDDFGRLTCVTTPSGTADSCKGTPDASKVLARHVYDKLDRMVGTRVYSGGSSWDRLGTYGYDALDRVVRHGELHPGDANDRSTAFSHVGLSDQVSSEKVTPKTTGATTTRSYAYDATERRVGMADSASGKSYTYGYDPHGSVSLLLEEDGEVKATYGYTPYGKADTTLTKGDTDPANPTNPYRYTGRRIDPVSGTLDMGARRFSPEAMHFLTQDVLSGALGDLSLTSDALTQNRYALAGGNPVSFVEWDGHLPTEADGTRIVGSGTGPNKDAEERNGDQGDDRPVAGLVFGIGSRGGEPARGPLVSALRKQGYRVKVFDWCFADKGTLGDYSCAANPRFDPQRLAPALRDWAHQQGVDVLVGQSKGGVLIYAMLGRIGLGSVPAKDRPDDAPKPLPPLPDLDRAVSINSPLTQTFAIDAGHDIWDQVVTQVGLHGLSKRQKGTDLASVWNSHDVVGSPPPLGVRDVRYSRGSFVGGICGHLLPFGCGEHSEPWHNPCVAGPIAHLSATGDWPGVSC